MAQPFPNWLEDQTWGGRALRNLGTSWNPGVCLSFQEMPHLPVPLGRCFPPSFHIHLFPLWIKLLCLQLVPSFLFLCWAKHPLSFADNTCDARSPYGAGLIPQLLPFWSSSQQMHLGKQQRGSQVLGPLHPHRRLRRDSSSWLWTSPALIIVAVWGSEPMDETSFCLSLSI